jgi:Sigma-70, region 4
LPVPAAPAGESADDTVDLGPDAESAELRAIVGAALAGLDPGDREIVELNLRHGLDAQDLADVLGVSVSQAEALASRARSRFEASLGALLIARTGQESCPELAAMMSRWDGQLNVLLRKRISRHTEHCEQCGDRWRHELNPAMLLSMLPVALPPPGLRDQLFYLIDDMGPAASAYRAGVIHRAGPFGWSGFPEPLDPPHADHRPTARVLAAGGVVFGSAVLKPHAGDHTTAAGATPYSAAPAPSVLPEVTVRSKPHSHSSPPAFAAPNVPWITATTPTGPIARSRPSSGSTAPPQKSPPSPTPTPAPSSPATPTPSVTPTPTPSSPATPTPSVTPTDSASPTAPASTLVPSAALVALTLTVGASAP